MSVLVVGLNHRTADVALLERVAVPADELPKALRSLTALEHVVEAVVLSTCNRVEVYAHVSRFHAALDEIVSWIAGRADLASEGVLARAITAFDHEAAAHLFGVTAGIDSVILGERQIALQVKHAANVARDEGASRRVLQKLFNQAIAVSREVRGETAIGSGVASMVDVGLDAALEHLPGGLQGRTVLLVGAGKMGGLAATRLADEGVGRVLVRNRSLEKARRLAERLGGEVVGDGGLVDAVAAADLVICCAGASQHLVDPDLVRAAQDRRPAPIVLLDLAMPRNVHPSCAELDDVVLVGLEEVRGVAAARAEYVGLGEARAIVADGVDRFRAWSLAVKIEPTIRALRSRAEEVRRSEFERFSGRLAQLDDREREVVEALTRGIVNTVLHEPTVRLKSLAERGGAEHYAIALRELFDLDE
jgi:glutamyl-tRNA reductase